jgi:hypothetical protein
MVGDWSSFKEESSYASCAFHFHHSCKKSLTICFRQCLTLGKAGEYNCVAITFSPMTSIIPLEDIVAAQC